MEKHGTTMHNEVDALKMDPFPGLFSLDIRTKIQYKLESQSLQSLVKNIKV